MRRILWTRYRHILLMTAAFAFAACSDSTFSGADNTLRKQGQEQNSADNGKGTAKGDDRVNLGNSMDGVADLDDQSESGGEFHIDEVRDLPNGDAIADCLEEWGDHPFTLDKIKKHRKIKAEATMLGNTSVVDSRVTDSPELVVVKVASSTLGAATVTLKNSNAWYCFDLAGQTLGSTKVLAHCDAQVANFTSSSGTLGNSQFSTSCDL